MWNCRYAELSFRTPYFRLTEFADTLICALAARPEVKNLTAVSNNAGVGQFGLGTRLFLLEHVP